ncbi:Uncharacterised protein [uncultured archaeon]|nr:Uncharacterised protein [uncultured archaeon]
MAQKSAASAEAKTPEAPEGMKAPEAPSPEAGKAAS